MKLFKKLEFRGFKFTFAKRIEDLYKNVEQTEGEEKNKFIAELNKELQQV